MRVTRSSMQQNTFSLTYFFISLSLIQILTLFLSCFNTLSLFLFSLSLSFSHPLGCLKRFFKARKLHLYGVLFELKFEHSKFSREASLTRCTKRMGLQGGLAGPAFFVFCGTDERAKVSARRRNVKSLQSENT